MCLYPVIVPNPAWARTLDAIASSGVPLDCFDLNISPVVTVPCGSCYECLRDNAYDWQVRCIMEARKYSDNCFITLTYKETDGQLFKRDAQLFFKRLRRSGAKFRYFGCGEYGSKGQRPHFHFVLFGWKPPDLKPFFKRGKIWVYQSKFLADKWKHGFVSVEEYDDSQNVYASLYMQKQQKVDLQISKKVLPFRMMSRRPGIGGDCENPAWIETDKVYYNGKFRRIPRYWLNRLANLGYNLEELKFDRMVKAELFKRCSSPDSLKLRIKKEKDFFYKVKNFIIRH